ncbi:MAG: dicarboxylate/amino acid:cation symporter [Oligoflexia bacterium]|nr:dicarboxylate/amino acid:cation symporter [Oligoflexia bacterium]
MVRFSLALQLVSALVLGAIVGVVLGKDAEPLGEVGLVIIRLLKALSIPLIFFAIIDAFCKTQIPKRKGAKLVFITTINSCVAIIIALTISNLFPIKDYVDLEKLKASIALPVAQSAGAIPTLNLQSILQGFIPTSFFEPFVSNNIIPVILLALFLGAALRKLINSQHSDEVVVFQKFISTCFRLITTILGWVIRIIPLAVFAVIAKTVGLSGFEVFNALGVFVGLVVLGLLVHVFLYYSMLLVFFVHESPMKFLKKGSEPIIAALGTGSSLATLPVTLKTLSEKMKVSDQSSRLAACIGTNLNNDGIILYEAVAVIFIAQLHGVSMDFNQQISMSMISIAAAAGIAGIPEAGFITLSLVVGAVGLPLSTVPLLLPVDWFLGRLRAATNVTSDMIVATLLDRAGSKSKRFSFSSSKGR